MNWKDVVAVGTHGPLPDIDGMIPMVIFHNLIYEQGTIRIFFENTDHLTPESIGLLTEMDVKKIIFIDTAPSEQMGKELEEMRIEVEVYDHHPWEKFEGQTATSLALKSLNFLDLDEKKKELFINWSIRSDFKGAAGDPFNFASSIRAMYESFSAEEIYKWTEKMVMAELKSKQGEKEKARKLFLNLLNEYMKKHQNNIETFERMKVRTEKIEGEDKTKKFKVLEDDMNLIVRAGAILEIFGEESMNDWLLKAFTGIRRNQEEFEETLKKIKKYSQIITMNCGKRKDVVLLCDGFDEANTNRAGRYYVKKKFNDNKFDKISGKKRIIPVVVQINEENKGFQIYGNGDNVLMSKITRALRTEILKSRGKEIPSNWRVLEQEGTLLGTEPLYYVKGHYGIILWGSLTRSDVMEVPDEILDKIERIITICIDNECYLHNCRETGRCNNSCEIFAWRLPKCWKIRKWGKNSNLRSN